MWPLGVSTGSFYPFLTTDQAIGAIGEAGFEVLELFIQCPSEVSASFAQRCLRELEASGVRAHSLHLHSWDVLPFSPYPPRIADTDALVRRALDMAATLGVRVVNWHGAERRRLDTGQVTVPQVLDVLARWQAWADEAAITMTLENVSWAMFQSVGQVAEARALYPALHFTFDSFQAMESGSDPAAMIAAMGPQIATVHLSDYRAGGARHSIPGEGDIAWLPLFHALVAQGYTGPLLIELSHHTAESIGPALTASRRFVESVVADLPAQA